MVLQLDKATSYDSNLGNAELGVHLKESRLPVKAGAQVAVCSCFAGNVKGTPHPAFRSAEVQAAAIVAALTGK
jgi:hypothetical protein